MSSRWSLWFTSKPGSATLFQLLPDNFGAVLDEFLVVDPERRGEMAVDVEFAGDLVLNENRHNDFRFCLQRTGQVAGIFADVVDDDRFAAGSGGPANSLVERNSRVRSHGAHESLQHQHGRLGAGFEHVKA